MPRKKVISTSRMAPSTRTSVHKMSFTEKEEILCLININKELRVTIQNNSIIAIGGALHSLQDGFFCNEIRFNNMYFQQLMKKRNELEALLLTAGIDIKQVLSGNQINMPTQLACNSHFKFLITDFHAYINLIIDPGFRVSQFLSFDLQTLWGNIPATWALFNSTHHSSFIRQISYYISSFSPHTAEALTTLPTVLSVALSMPLGKIISSHFLCTIEDPLEADCLENYEGLSREHFIDKRKKLVEDRQVLDAITSRSEIILFLLSSLLIFSILNIFMQPGFSFGINTIAYIFIFLPHINRLINTIFGKIDASTKETTLNNKRKHLDVALNDYINKSVEINITNKTKNSYFILSVKLNSDYTQEVIRDLLIESLKHFKINVKSYDEKNHYNCWGLPNKRNKRKKG